MRSLVLDSIFNFEALCGFRFSKWFVVFLECFGVEAVMAYTGL